VYEHPGVRGQFYTIKYVIPHFLDQGGGCIVNMASLSSYPPFTAAADYSASKAAVKRLTESVAYEYAGDNNPRQRRRSRPYRDAHLPGPGGS